MTAAVEAFRLGVRELMNAAQEHSAPGAPGPARTRAAEAFRTAVKLDPTMSDAVMGLIAAGDNSRATLFKASRARNLYVHSRAEGLLDGELLSGLFDLHVYGIHHPLRRASEASIALACALAYPADGTSAQWQEAAEQLQQHLGDRHGEAHDQQLATTVLLGMYLATEQWTAITDLEPQLKATQWDQPLLQVACATVTAQAYANLGAFDEALRRVSGILDDPREPAQHLRAQARLIQALVLREQGDEERAQQIIAELMATDTTGTVAAYRPATQRLKLTSAAAIATRTDAWDPASGHDPVATADREESARTREQWLEDASRVLEEQIGMAAVKQQIAKLRATVQVSRMREKAGLSIDGSSRHLVFTGPPGTGKTTIARVVAQIFAGLGVVDTPKVVEASRVDFVGTHLGHTAPKTNALIDSAVGGVLFVDEVYTLIQTGLAGGDAFGREAVDTLLARMENDRDRLVVIIAGYDEEVDRFLASNEGLASRFSRRIRFASYTPDELVAIAEVIANKRDSVLSEGARDRLMSECAQLSTTVREGKSAIDVVGNGRFMRNVIEGAEEERNYRLAQDPELAAAAGAPDDSVRQALMTITEPDMGEAIENLLADNASR
ncbi:type VII secretion AAA-ATPase EccA [Nocardia altamirensis]|uniref:type VII secretion AAA-ATPase EccA n=1 Tax=Nocardia altamirensis TaxID=472158 RepID=UPI00083FE117|nr:type VII secretion AAA-ATPase EccA [Nocardia altamirensis]